MARSIKIALSEINIDLNRFQFRQHEFNQSRVDWLVANWNKDILDPLDVWQDDQGKYWLLSGHHRAAAAKALGLDAIVCRIQPGDETQARMLAMASNANRLEYSPIEYCNCLEYMISTQGATKTEAAEKLSISPSMATKYYALRHLKQTNWSSHLHVPHIAALAYEVGLACEKGDYSSFELDAILKLVLEHDLRLSQVQRLMTDVTRAKKAAPAGGDDNQVSMFDISSFSADRVATVIHQRSYFDKIGQRVWFMYELLNNAPEGCEIPEEIAEPLRLHLRRLNSHLAGEEGESIPVRANAKTGKKMRIDFAEAVNN